MFNFTALLGAQSDSPASQSLLELDNGIKILIDVGWDSSFDMKMLSELERHTPSIDLILLTHPTLEHMGAYAHACKHIPAFNAIPVYSTFPVSNLGRLLLQDLYLSTPLAFGKLSDTPAASRSAQEYSPTAYQPPTELPHDALKLPPIAAEIDSYCTKIVTLKYSQPTPLHSAVARVAGKLGSVTITAYSAGHSLGGTIWKIQQGQESIVHAVDWNLSRENCLRSAAFLSSEDGRVQEALARPSALVCSTRNAMVTNIAGGRKRRDELLLETIRTTAKENGGTVLIPTDSVGRVLELAYLLEHAWRSDDKLSGKNKGVGLYLAGRKVKRLSQVVGSMLEWMDEAVVREFEAIAEASSRKNDKKGRRGNRNDDADHEDGKSGDSGNKAGPFDFLHLNLIATPHQLNKVLNSDTRGKVIIASDSSLEWGLSRDAIVKLAGDDKNVVVLTERGDHKAGLAGKIWTGWKEATSQTEDITAGKSGTLSLTSEVVTHTKSPLQGDELLIYERHTAAQQALTSPLLTTGLPAAAPEDDDAESESDDEDSDSERQGKALTTAAQTLHGPTTGPEKVDIGINVLLRPGTTYDFDVRNAKGRNRMFPFQIRRKRIDEYGEVVRPDDYMRAEERADDDAAVPAPTVASVPDTRVMGKKRKWNEHTEATKPTRGNDSTGKKSRKPLSTHGSEDGEYSPPASDFESDGEEDTLSTPSKLTTHTQTITFRLRATFIDFAGLHDQKSLRMLLPLLDPKKLILVGGHREETTYLAEFYREKAALSSRTSGREVFSPRIGATVNASVDTNAWTVKLSPALTRALKWQSVRGLGVVHVLGRVVPASDAPDTKKQKTIEGAGGGAGELVLDVLPPAVAAATRSVKQPIHVGDIRLADLRRVLQKEGHTAEFRGEGTLLVDGICVVRKTGVGSVSVEDGGGGWIEGSQGKGTTFTEVRRRVYDGLAVVAG